MRSNPILDPGCPSDIGATTATVTALHTSLYGLTPREYSSRSEKDPTRNGPDF